MRVFPKIAISAVVFLATYFFSFWVIFAQVTPESVWWLAQIMSLLLAVAVTIFIWRKLGGADQSLAKTFLTWAIVAGAVGFAGGFFGPLIFTPEANQGPLFGILITGPAGFVIGGIAGLIYGHWRGPDDAKPLD